MPADQQCNGCNGFYVNMLIVLKVCNGSPDLVNRKGRASKLAIAYLFAGLSDNTRPAIAAPMPPNNNHNVLSVGVPLKVRERDELAEFEASMP
jgi:hypothetical protein